MKRLLLIALVFFFTASTCLSQSETGQQKIFWELSGTDAISWDLTDEDYLPHSDNLEMSGKKAAMILTYEVDQNRNLKVSRDVIFPQLRHFIESSANRWRYYRAYLRHDFTDDFLPKIIIGDRTFEPGPLDSVRIDGSLHFHHSESQGIQLNRTLVPSMSERLAVEGWSMVNTTDSTIEVELGDMEFKQEFRGQNGSFTLRAFTKSAGKQPIVSGGSFDFTVCFSAQLDDEPIPELSFEEVFAERSIFLDSMRSNLILETPDPVLNRLFEFSKIRAAESIYDTKMGLVHSPGGGRYYTGVWANDQAEYSGPFFPFLGYQTGNIAAMNAYRVFHNNIPEGEGNFWSSFEMEGTVTCCGGDRGDAAMIAYGASQYALFSGNKLEATELWPLIEWCLDYCKSKRNEFGVVTSDSDEMEGRIATGGANLATSSLYYGALVQSAMLADALGFNKDVVEKFDRRAADLRQANEAYFGAEIDGLETYQYFKGHPYLRHWICLPLVMGIDDRKDGTLDALFNNLWTDNGVKVEHNPNLEEPDLFWDRGTLYAFRGAFKAGAANRSLEKLRSYSQTRLLGFHVPYVVEAWPEGNMAHLSAESALYCRIFTEGLLGIVPTGFRSFEMTPNLPDEWDFFRLKKIRAFGETFDIEIERTEKDLVVRVTQGIEVLMEKKVSSGKSIEVQLK